MARPGSGRAVGAGLVPARPGAGGVGRGQRDFGADEGLQSCGLRRLEEPRRAVHAVAVDERHGGQLERCRALDEILGQRRAVQKREGRGGAQLGVRFGRGRGREVAGFQERWRAFSLRAPGETMSFAIGSSSWPQLVLPAPRLRAGGMRGGFSEGRERFGFTPPI